MPKTRKSHPPSLKAKVAVEAIKAHKTAAQIAQMFGVHPTQVGGWKKQALAGLPDIFGNGREQMRQQADTEKDELYKQIGQLKVELDFLKKRAGLIDGRQTAMDRSHSSAPQHPTAVRAAGPAALNLLLPASAGERGELAAVAYPRRVVSEVTFLWQPEDGRPVRRGSPSRPAARNLELRSGLAVHLGRFPGAAQKAWDLDQHGWPRARARQCFHRAAVALAQIRVALSWRLLQRARTVSGTGKLLPLLQSPAPADRGTRPRESCPARHPVSKPQVGGPHQALGYRTPADLFPYRLKRERSSF